MCIILYKQIKQWWNKDTTPNATTGDSTAQPAGTTNQVACAHRDVPSDVPCLECKTEKKAARKYRWRLILCLAWPFALQSLDSTMCEFFLLFLNTWLTDLIGQHRNCPAMDRWRLWRSFTAELDRFCFQPDLRRLYSLLVSTGRCLWEEHVSQCCHHIDAHRQYTLHCCSNQRVPGSPPWPGLPRYLCSRYQCRHPNCSCR